MTMSSLMRTGPDGRSMQAILSLMVLRSLDDEKRKALASMGIRSMAELLHYVPIHNARMLVAAAEGRIGHDLDITSMVDAAHHARSPASLLGESPRILEGIGKVRGGILRDAFGVETVAGLASFAPFVEAERYLGPESDRFSEPRSAPDELMPTMTGNVSSTVCYSSFVRERTISLSPYELAFDLRRLGYLDERLATIFQFDRVPDIHLGYVAKLKQDWVNMGTHLGEVVHSLTLAPGEIRKLAIVDWKQSVMARRNEETKVEEHLNSSLMHKRALDEVTRATAREHQEGGTSIDASTMMVGLGAVAGGAVVGAAGGAISGGLLGSAIGSAAAGVGALPGALVGAASGAAAVAGVGAVGAAGVFAGNNQLGVIESDTDGKRKILGEVQQRITDVTKQKSSSIRSLWSTVVLEEGQAEHEEVRTRVVANYNHSHALNVEYYELLQHYHAQIHVDSVEPILFLPIKPPLFDIEFIARYWDVLKKGIDDKDTVREFERIMGRYSQATSLPDAAEVDDLDVKNITVELDEFQLGCLMALPGDRRWEVSVQLITEHGHSLADHEFSLSPLSGCTWLADFGSSYREGMLKVKAIKGISIRGLGPYFDNMMTVNACIRCELANPENRVWQVEHSCTERCDLEAEGILRRKFSLQIPIDIGRLFQRQIADAMDRPRLDILARVVRYINERRYHFTRLLLGSVERAQMVDMIEALLFTNKRGPLVDRLSRILDRLRAHPLAVIDRQSVIDSAINTFSISEEERNRGYRGIRFTKFVDPSPIAMTENALVFRLKACPWYQGIEAGEKPMVEIRTRRFTPRPEKEEDAGAATAMKKSIPSTKEEETVRETTGVVEKSHVPDYYLTPVPEPSSEVETETEPESGLIAKPVKPAPEEDPLKRIAEYHDDIKDFMDTYPRKAIADSIYLPTSGVFAEAILGRANASEKVDATRFTQWLDAPIPHEAPAILPVVMGQRGTEVGGLEVNKPDATLQQMTPAAMPGTNLALALQAVPQGNMFRDMSRAEQLTSVLSSLASLADKSAALAGNMAGSAAEQAMNSATQLGLQVAKGVESLMTTQMKALNLPPTTATEKAGAVNAILDLAKGRDGNQTTAYEDAVANLLGADIERGADGSQPRAAATTTATATGHETPASIRQRELDRLRNILDDAVRRDIPPSAEAMADPLRKMFDDVVLPRLTAATTDDGQLEGSLREWLDWMAHVQTMGLGSLMGDRDSRARDLAAKGLSNGINQANRRAVAQSNWQIVGDAVRWQTQAELLGLDGDPQYGLDRETFTSGLPLKIVVLESSAPPTLDAGATDKIRLRLGVQLSGGQPFFNPAIKAIVNRTGTENDQPQELTADSQGYLEIPIGLGPDSTEIKVRVTATFTANPFVETEVSFRVLGKVRVQIRGRLPNDPPEISRDMVTVHPSDRVEMKIRVLRGTHGLGSRPVSFELVDDAGQPVQGERWGRIEDFHNDRKEITSSDGEARFDFIAPDRREGTCHVKVHFEERGEAIDEVMDIQVAH